MIVLGLMAGTSLDGIDAAVTELTRDGDRVRLRLLAHRTTPYAEQTYAALVASLPPAPIAARTVAEVDTAVGREFAAAAVSAAREAVSAAPEAVSAAPEAVSAAPEAVLAAPEAVLAAPELGAAREPGSGGVDLVVSHGQTFYHLVEDGRVLGSVQLGQPAWIAEATGAPVVADVRARDIAAGGQGAPLVSLLDVLLLRERSGAEGSAGSAVGAAGGAAADVPAALNLGGIANLTVVRPDDAVAFDTGPGNGLMDLLARELDLPHGYDEDGALAATGTVSPELLAEMLADPYFTRPAPKSTGKEYFSPAWLDRHRWAHPEVVGADLMATLAELTAATIAAALVQHDCGTVYVSGGGFANGHLRRRLEARWDGTVRGTGVLGIPEEAKEACLMALLGYFAWHGAPAALPECTGARHASRLGAIVPGAGPLRLPEPWAEPPTSLVVDP
ncbi:MAG TPA: anhydro-N-acetylmuramic acid kinase [Segeticoccus sp.]|uniref:anhydro-N-acetylmuramic acid kinase n=1 Tax=Segeticoccus sp. TaxID=2706531 RepID=UPI002D8033BC|nr:anhydro-N-acetylmuramic acid kinase [Segeticoccus sp.]HET8600379.1 anhydro-N-acetylmuramic acid kinase [Segeticoccus sp.]